MYYYLKTCPSLSILLTTKLMILTCKFSIIYKYSAINQNILLHKNNTLLKNVL